MGKNRGTVVAAGSLEGGEATRANNKDLEKIWVNGLSDLRKSIHLGKESSKRLGKKLETASPSWDGRDG